MRRWNGAATDWKHVIICINDTLQSYNHQLDRMSPRDAYANACTDGDAWLERNQPLVGGLPSHEIYRWDDWKV